MNAFLQLLADIFKLGPKYHSLEAYISAGNPQNPADIDRLEREFNAMYKNSNMFDKYY